MNGLDELKRRYVWPAIRRYSNLPEWSLDGGGKVLVIDAIRRKNAAVLVEIGSFLGGSALVWLRAKADLTIVCIDPWEGDWWAGYARAHGRERLANVFAEPDGPHQAFLSLMWDHRHRVIPMKGRAPEALFELHELGVRPDVVFVDSNKSKDDLEVCDRLFPEALLTGDDWTWYRQGAYPMQEIVKRFSLERGYSYYALRATWVISRALPSMSDRLHHVMLAGRDLVARARRRFVPRQLR